MKTKTSHTAGKAKLNYSYTPLYLKFLRKHIISWIEDEQRTREELIDAIIKLKI